jgi:hypothetical protein
LSKTCGTANVENNVKSIGQQYDALAQMEIDNEYNKKEEVADEDLGTVAPKASKLKPTADANEIGKDRLTNELDQLEKRYGAEDIKLNAYFKMRKDLTTQLHALEIKSINDKYNAEVAAKTKAAKSKYDEDVTLANKIKVEDAKQKALKIAEANYKAATTKTDADVKKEAEKNTAIEKANLAKEQAVWTVNFDWKEAKKEAEKESLKISAELDEAAFNAINDRFAQKDKEIKAKYEKQRKAFEEATLASVENTVEATRLIAEKSTVIDGLINTEKAKNNLDRIEAEIKAFNDSQANKVKTVEFEREKGYLSNTEAKQQTDVINQKTRDRLALYIAELERLAPTSAKAKETLEQLRLKMLEIPPKKDTEAEMQAFWNGINSGAKETADSAAKSGLSQFFMDIATGAKSGTEAVRDFGRNFALSMAKVASDALAAWAVMKLLGFATGMFSGGGAAPRVDAPNTTANANVAHTGGIAGSGLRQRTVDMSLFTAAPRYHVGGIAGMQPGEVPAILMKGEEVLTQKDPRHVANGGGQGRGVTIINEFTRAGVLNHIASSEGNDVLFNIIGDNPTRIRSLLGI